MGIKKKLKKVVKGAAKVAKKVAPIAAPIVGGALGGPVGAGIGGAIGGGARGGLKGALLGGALGYGGATLANSLGGAGGTNFLPGTTDAMPSGFGDASSSFWTGDKFAQAAPFGTTDFNMGAAANAGDLAALQDVGTSYIPGSTATPSIFGSAGYGDPFMDAYTPYGTGGGATGLPVPSNSGGFNWKDAALATSSAGNLAKILRDKGINVDPRTLGMLGTGLSTGLGVYGANQQDKALQGVINNQRAVTQPFLDDVMDIFKNPDKFYQRPEVMGAIDASMRGLSAKVGNPIDNPGAIAQQAAYNTGLYNNTLNTRLATALGGQDTLNRLQTQQALNKGNALNAVGSGLGSMLSTAPNYGELLGQYLFSNRTA